MKALAVMGGLFLLAIFGCAGIVGTAVDQVDQELNGGTVGASEDVAARASVGQSLSLEGTSYQVMSVRTAQSIGDEFTGATANGTFILVDLSLTNEKSEPATIMSEAFRVVGSNGSAYSTSDDALLASEDQFLLEEIQPGLTESGTLVFDLPAEAIAGAELQVEDLFSTQTGRFALGL